MSRVTVIGAGVMGRGIAELYALAGFQVGLCDVSDELLRSSVRAMRDDLALMEEEGLVPPGGAESAAARVEPTTSLEESLAGTDFVTEVIPEVLELKLELFERVERCIAPSTVIASNTSTLPITKLAQRARLPGRILVTHFFNPAQLVPLVEVVPHPETPPGVTSAVMQLMRRIGKSPVLLKKEIPGFIANRLQAAVAREAFHLVEQGIADAESIDAAITEGPGFRWAFIGPILTAELGGLDTWQRVIDNLSPELSRATSAPAIIVDHVQRGELGAKTGRGLRSYEAGSLRELLRKRDRSFIGLLRLKSQRAGH